LEGAVWKVLFGRCCLEGAVWKVLFRRCCLEGAVWKVLFGRCCLGGAVWKYESRNKFNVALPKLFFQRCREICLLKSKMRGERNLCKEIFGIGITNYSERQNKK
jgi:hypothetical protein